MHVLCLRWLPQVIQNFVMHHANSLGWVQKQPSSPSFIWWRSLGQSKSFAMIRTSMTCPSSDYNEDNLFNSLNFWAKIICADASLWYFFCTPSRLRDLLVDSQCLRFESMCNTILVGLHGECGSTCPCATNLWHTFPVHYFFVFRLMVDLGCKTLRVKW